MGVPRLFKWLRERYPFAFSRFRLRSGGIVEQILPSNLHPIPRGFTVDNLFIDANAIVHNCAQKVFNYGERKRCMDPYRKLSFREKEEKVFELTFRKILDLTRIAIPREILYIAIDGVAPAAKMVQQRQRRFLAASKVKDSSNRKSFNPNCISPGTEFMTRLCEYIKYAILLHVSKRYAPKVEIAFSSANVPGEGEHKIMAYVREHPSIANKSNCIYGPDGDLIMLVLASPSERFCILRDDLDDVNAFVRIDIESVRRELAFDLRGRSSPIDVKRVMRDFVVMTSLVGNDFLPKIQMFYLLEDGMRDIIDTYVSKFSSRGSYLTEGDEIVSNSLKRFVAEIASRERRSISAQIVKSRNKDLDPKFVDSILLKSSPPGAPFDYAKYRKLYDERLIRDGGTTIRDTIDKYVEGLRWVLTYYFDGCPDFSWYYPNYRAPLMIDLALNIRTDASKPFVENEPHDPYQQLLSILPPRSAELLPEGLRPLLTDVESPLADYNPSEFRIDYEGKYQEHQGIPILPFVEYSRLKEIYEENVSEEDKTSKRNKRSLPFLYSPSDSKRLVRTEFGEVRGGVEICKLE